MAKLPPQIHAAYIQAFTNALVTVYVVAAAAVAAFAFLLSWALEQRPLRDRVASASRIGESFAMPKQTDSLAEASRALTVLVGREGGGAWWRASPSGPGSISPRPDAGCWPAWTRLLCRYQPAVRELCDPPGGRSAGAA